MKWDWVKLGCDKHTHNHTHPSTNIYVIAAAELELSQESLRGSRHKETDMNTVKRACEFHAYRNNPVKNDNCVIVYSTRLSNA